MTIIKAHYDGKAFIPEEPVQLPSNQPLTLHVDTATTQANEPTQEELLAKLRRIEEMARECQAPEADWSRDSIYSGNLDDPR